MTAIGAPTSTGRCTGCLGTVADDERGRNKGRRGLTEARRLHGWLLAAPASTRPRRRTSNCSPRRVSSRLGLWLMRPPPLIRRCRFGCRRALWRSTATRERCCSPRPRYWPTAPRRWQASPAPGRRQPRGFTPHDKLCWAPASSWTAEHPRWNRLSFLVRAGLGGRIGSGRQWFSWIHIEDWLAVLRWGLEGSNLAPEDGPAAAPARGGSLRRDRIRYVTPS